MAWRHRNIQHAYIGTVATREATKERPWSASEKASNDVQAGVPGGQERQDRRLGFRRRASTAVSNFRLLQACKHGLEEGTRSNKIGTLRTISSRRLATCSRAIPCPGNAILRVVCDSLTCHSVANAGTKRLLHSEPCQLGIHTLYSPTKPAKQLTQFRVVAVISATTL